MRDKFSTNPMTVEDRNLQEKRSKSNRNTAAAIVGALIIGGPIFGTHHNFGQKGGKNIGGTTLVHAGDTEWSVADRINGNGDIRETVYEMDKIMPKDAAHEGHLVQPGDKVAYNSKGKPVSYQEAVSP